MVTHCWRCWLAVGFALVIALPAWAQQAGSIRGVVYDDDFDAPLARAEVTIVETDQTVTATDQGNYVFNEVPAGMYTLVFSKEGYTREVISEVVVEPGRLTDVDARLSGEFVEMEEFVVEELQIGGATEVGLLRLRMQSPALLDSISAELLSRSGFSDAASALNLVAGASVQDGKFAVIRGLPDRFVSSQLNGVRLPTADEDKRAVELDLFPAEVIESIQVSKTFTPDQQGDASGGAVNIRLKSIPEQTIFKFSVGTEFNTQVAGNEDFLTYDGGGIGVFGKDGDLGIQTENLGENWEGAVGVSPRQAPLEYELDFTVGGSHVFDTGVKIGAYANVFYERDAEFYDNGIDDSLWQVNPGEPLTPQIVQNQGAGDFKTSLFDVTRGKEILQYGGLGGFGIESDNHAINMTYLFTRVAEDVATLAEDTRGKQFFFPEFDPDDPMSPGSDPDNVTAAPYIRTETLNYTERTTESAIVSGTHTLPLPDVELGEVLTFLDPEVDWTISRSTAESENPDRREFGSIWLAPSFIPGGIFTPDIITDPVHRPFKPAANFTLGNLQRVWEEIKEESDQIALNLTLPFEQWTGDEGYFKFGLFDDQVVRTFNQDTFSNFNDNAASFVGDFDEFWSQVFPLEDHPITDGPPFVDVDFRAEQHISAWYAMIDMPLTSNFNVIGGARFESTEIDVVNFPEDDATWFPPGSLTPVALNPGDADVDFEQNDVLPSIGFIFTPIDQVTLRGSYSETIARQTFKELTPIQQQEFLGADVFIGNPELEMAALENYDLRVDYTPYEGGLLSASYFKKNVTNPIETVQRVVGFTFTTPVNFPEGELSGFEFEARQDLGRLWDGFQGLSVGGNATIIDSEVDLPEDEIEMFAQPGIETPMTTRDMTNAPEHLYNLWVTYDLEQTGTQVSLFYTVKGDTLVAGATESDGNFVPSVYAKEFGTLNLTIAQRIGEHLKLSFKAKNLTNPTIEEVYRSDFIDDDVVKTSFTKGIDYSVSLSGEFKF